MRTLTRLTALTTTALAFLWGAGPAAAAPALDIGDDAPVLDGDQWLPGNASVHEAPVERVDDGRIYMIEFWATWCKPCVENIPRLQGLQKRHRDRVSIIGVTSEEREDVDAFLQETGLVGAVEYDLIVDPDASIAAAWMEANGQTAIPRAFLVGESGRIEWVGHPRDAEAVLDKMLDGTWDPYAANAWPNRAAGYELAVEWAWRESDAFETIANIDRAIDHYQAPTAPPQIGHELATSYRALRSAVLLTGGEVDYGYSYVRAMMTREWDNDLLLNNLAWLIVDNPDVPERDLELALTLAVRANELTDYRDAAQLDTLARVHFERGDAATALQWQEQAIQALEPDDDVTPLLDALVRYQQAAAGPRVGIAPDASRDAQPARAPDVGTDHD